MSHSLAKFVVISSLHMGSALDMSEVTKAKTVCRRCGSAVAIIAAAAAGSSCHHLCGCTGNRQHCRMAACLRLLPSQVHQLRNFQCGRLDVTLLRTHEDSLCIVYLQP